MFLTFCAWALFPLCRHRQMRRAQRGRLSGCGVSRSRWGAPAASAAGPSPVRRRLVVSERTTSRRRIAGRGGKGRPQAGGKERQRRSRSCRLCRPQFGSTVAKRMADTRIAPRPLMPFYVSHLRLADLRRPVGHFLGLPATMVSQRRLTAACFQAVNLRCVLTTCPSSQEFDAGALTAAKRRDTALTLGPEGEGSPVLTLCLHRCAPALKRPAKLVFRTRDCFYFHALPRCACRCGGDGFVHAPPLATGAVPTTEAALSSRCA